MPSSDARLPRITVVTPILNAATTLAETMDSVLEQEYPDLEYVVVDGGSVDGSLEIVAKRETFGVRLLRGTDATLYDAVAKGFDAATGSILAWLNADDMYEPGALLKVGRHFAARPQCSVVYFDDTVWKQGWRVPNRPQRDVGFRELLDGHVLYQDSVFFRREAYEFVGGLERVAYRLAGDYDLWLRLSERYRLHRLRGHGSCFRVRPSQLSGDWIAYQAEMKQVRRVAQKRLPPLFRLRSFPGYAARSVAAVRERRTRPFSYPLVNEGLEWSPVAEAPRKPLTSCRCLLCGRPPDRLLFSTPDTRFGDRTVRRVYYCERCRLAFLFPMPDATEMATLYEATYSADIAPLGDPRPGTYSPYRVASLLGKGRLYDLLGWCYIVAGSMQRRVGWPNIRYDDIVPINEAKDASILELGCFEGRVLEVLKSQGYTKLHGTDFNLQAAAVAASRGFDVYGGDINATDWPGKPMDAIVLNQLIEHVADPVGVLTQLKRRLVSGGRVYLSTPNLDSRWLDHYGPAWSHWHFPFHCFITGRQGLSQIARRAGYRVAWMKTNTPAHWAYMSDLLGVRGLGGYVSHNIVNPDPRLWRRSLGALLASWLTLDWQLRGDCLHACLVRVD